jgi:hypothetical protein
MHTNYSQVVSLFTNDIMQIKCKIASKCPLTMKDKS